MVIKQIQVKNFRLLKEFTMEMEDELSLVIGKNNVGKTSLLVILDKFLNQGDRKGFQYNDFNLDFRCQLKDLIEKDIVDDTKYKEIGIQLRLLIGYDDHDDLYHQLYPFLSNLSIGNENPNWKFIVLKSFAISPQEFVKYHKVTRSADIVFPYNKRKLILISIVNSFNKQKFLTCICLITISMLFDS